MTAETAWWDLELAANLFGASFENQITIVDGNADREITEPELKRAAVAYTRELLAESVWEENTEEHACAVAVALGLLDDLVPA